MKKKLKNALSVDNLLRLVSQWSGDIPDQTTKIKTQISLHDHVMSAIAMFKLKYPSLLQFDKDRIDPAHANNLKTLFHGNCSPPTS